MTVSRERLSRWIAWLGGLSIAAVGASLYLQDGSYFLDEASVVLSFDERGILEAFTGQLAGGGQNFPRFYLLLIRGVRAVFGPETWATRLLPHLCFVAATLLWTRLLALRFGRRPALVLLGVTLIAVTPSWWFYSAVVKQYSLDVLVTLAVFSVPDRVFDDLLLRRKSRLRLVALLLPVLFSFVYVVAFLARLSGWAAYALRRRQVLPDLGASALLIGGLGLCVGVLYFTDLQHTMGRPGLAKMWGNCILSQSPGETYSILGRFFSGWYLGPSEYINHPKLAAPAVWALLAAGAVGILRVALAIVRPRPESDDPIWGSRSAGCLAGVVGVIATSGLLDYPICAGRLTLYAFFFQQVLILEGFEAGLALLARHDSPVAGRRIRAAVAAAASIVLIGATALTTFRVAERVTALAPLEDVRPLLADVPADTTDQVVVTACMERQIRTLPEGLGDRRVVYLPLENWAPALPRGEEVWIIHSRLIPGICERLRRELRGITVGLGGEGRRRQTAVVYHTRVRTKEQQRRHRVEALRALER